MEAIGKLTGGVAHDFNNLLSVISNGVALLRMSVTNYVSVKALDSMERAISRGATLSQQLLTFSHEQPIKQDPNDLNRLINSFESVLRRALKSSVRFDLKLAIPLPRVIIDAGQFEAALLNLILNAAEATADNGSITVQTEVVSLADKEVNHLPAGRYVKLSVIDTGEGIPAAFLPRAVEPFFSTKAGGAGTGLGLSQVYGLMQQSNGDLKIDSKVGHGTTVSLFIPSLGSEDAGQTSSSETFDKALVVDDQPDVLDMAAELFRTLGYEVLSANNGEEAVEVLKKNPDIEILFSDVIMPGMSGIDLGQRARDLIPSIKVILASGYAMPDLKLEGTDTNEFQFVSKPYRISEIVKKLRIAN